MTHSHHDPKHPHHHEEHHSRQHPGPALKRGVHRDWRFWAVIAMLAGIGMYVASENEMLQFGGGQPEPMAEAE